MSSVVPARPPQEPTDPIARVLVADDDRTAREHLAALLRGDGHAVEVCEDGAEALARVGQGGIDLVLLDVMMPRLSGTEACRLLKSMAGGAFLPIIMLTAKNDLPSRVEGLRMGADDYVGKPFDPEELSARVASMLRIKRLIGNLNEDRERLLRRAVHDELTGLPNRRHFEARLFEERKRAERYHEPFALVLVEVVGLSGERSGGALERHVARAAAAIKRSVREADVVGRHAETTFAALLPHTHFTGAIAATERILRDVAAALGDPDPSLSSVSIGAAVYPSRDARTPEGMLACAESALEEAQRAGGGNICIVQQRRYLYAPGASPPSRPEPPGTPRRPAASEPPTAGRRAVSEPPLMSPRTLSEPPLVSPRSLSEPPAGVEAFPARELEGRKVDR